MEELSDTRRGMLRKGAAALAAATITGSAGCTDSGGGGGDGGGSAGYTQWLPEPGIIDDSDHYRFNAINYSSLAEQEEFSDSTNLSTAERRWRPLTIGYEDVTMLLGFGSTQVIEAEFESADAVDSLTGSEDFQFEEQGEYEGVQLLRNSAGNVVFGVGDNVIITGTGGSQDGVETIQDSVETVVDTNNGDENRYVDESEAFGELTDRLGTGDSVLGVTQEPLSAMESDPTSGRFESQVASGRRVTVDGGTTDNRWVVVFETESDVDVGAVEEWVDQGGTQFSGMNDINVDSNGRSAVVEATGEVGSGT